MVKIEDDVYKKAYLTYGVIRRVFIWSGVTWRFCNDKKRQ